MLRLMLRVRRAVLMFSLWQDDLGRTGQQRSDFLLGLIHPGHRQRSPLKPTEGLNGPPVQLMED
jgi:hypothetical protein